MSWEEEMNGIKLYDKKSYIPINKKEIYKTERGDFVDIKIKLWKYICPECKEEKITLTINSYIKYGCICCSHLNGETKYHCGCLAFKDF